ncbi:DUF6907 domain-containing protein [Streptomyces sp. NRRL S-118]|uniref:DUF6907 domain-containing protein n=1 Tax=Streptomyces sp. NRRL S-118 TaxID=1463881 RepID=UPI0004CB0CB6|nr:hypothetical protein [Streptomyces sp. NRRL S-118]
MSITVPENFRPSGGLVKPFLPAIPTQPTAATVEPLAPRTWTFTDRATGEQKTFTCMRGCEMDHSSDVETPSYAEDVWCQSQVQDLTLPINADGQAEEFRVLGMTLNVRPFDKHLAQRLPHVELEMVDDHWVEGLDPDGFATVINMLESRLKRMRAVHAQLVELRAEYRKQVQA